MVDPMKYCVECGSKLQPGAKFCVNCGIQISATKSNDSGNNSDLRESQPMNSQPKYDQTNLTAKVRTPVKPIYGKGFKESENCFNCGSKYSSAKRCLVCDASRN
jgi:rRNA maturation endonuclease Nob1